MKIFKEPNLYLGWECPICKKSDISPVMLIPINGTETESGSRTFEAEQIHVSCLDLSISELLDKRKLIFMAYNEEE